MTDLLTAGARLRAKLRFQANLQENRCDFTRDREAQRLLVLARGGPREILRSAQDDKMEAQDD